MKEKKIISAFDFILYVGFIFMPIFLIALMLFAINYNRIDCWRKNKILEAGDDLYQDAATDKQWKEYINNKYHFDPPVCSNYIEN